MSTYDLIPGIISTLVLTPIIVILTYYFNKKYDYYHYLFLLIKEIEFDFSEMHEFPKNFDIFIKRERDWLPKGVTIKAVNFVPKDIKIFHTHDKNKEMIFKVWEKSYLYNYLVDDAYFLFMNKGYSDILQNQIGFVDSIKRAINSLKFDHSTDFNYKGGIMERITLFYFHCNEFNFLSHSIEERIKQKKYENIENEREEIFKIYKKYFDLISKEFCAIGTTRLKITRIQFYLKIVLTILIIIFICLYYISLTQNIDINFQNHSSATIQNFYYF